MANVSNPRKKFNYSIQIAPAPINPFLCQTADLPDVDIEQTSHGDTNHDVKTGGRVTVGNLSLDKIMTTGGADNYMYDWAMSVQDMVLGGGLVPSQYKRIVTVSELAEDGTSILNTWVCTGCWPTKVNGLSLDRMSSDNTIESVELSVDRMDKL